MVTKEFIEFLKTSSPSGYEKEARNWLYKKALEKGIDVEKDVSGNIIMSINNKSDALRIMIEGHIDEIGGQVLGYEDTGHLIFRENGGLDKSALVSQRVRFLNGTVGVIGKKTVHIEDHDERNKVRKLEELWIDCGFKDKKEAMKNIEIGEFFTFEPNATMLKNNLVVSKGIDDKVGAYIAYKVLEKLKDDPKFITGLYVVGTTQEEVGGFGARGVANKIKPDISISLDVDFASDIPDGDKKRLGEVALGKGLILKRNTDTNPCLFEFFKETCKKKKLKCQVCASAWDGGGTNATSIKYQAEGIATIDIGVPNRYMHTASEVVSFDDIESGIEMLVKVLKSINDEGINLVP